MELGWIIFPLSGRRSHPGHAWYCSLPGFLLSIEKHCQFFSQQQCKVQRYRCDNNKNRNFSYLIIPFFSSPVKPRDCFVILIRTSCPMQSFPSSKIRVYRCGSVRTICLFFFLLPVLPWFYHGMHGLFHRYLCLQGFLSFRIFVS